MKKYEADPKLSLSVIKGKDKGKVSLSSCPYSISFKIL